MPGGDGTGPVGHGPGTGRRLGNIAGNRSGRGIGIPKGGVGKGRRRALGMFFGGKYNPLNWFKKE